MKNIKVLMIDDNLALIKMVKEYFSDHASIDISLEAHDGIEGMKLIKEHQNDYDVVILDLIMPKLDGLGVLERIHNDTYIQAFQGWRLYCCSFGFGNSFKYKYNVYNS